MICVQIMLFYGGLRGINDTYTTDDKSEALAKTGGTYELCTSYSTA